MGASRSSDSRAQGWCIPRLLNQRGLLVVQVRLGRPALTQHQVPRAHSSSLSMTKGRNETMAGTVVSAHWGVLRATPTDL
mmetsp:Transcript_5697/g.13453  ORF Transcript_5697/g.13453 Transcript_5697/m.13453 type:complete len:80 (+) Transcript_5697:633-872(+)